jgi:hypothetical protein
VDVEVDGNQHHSIQRNSEYDADRDANLATDRWVVHRIRASEFRRAPARQVSALCETIEAYGGIEEAGARFVSTPTGPVRQLNLLEERAAYGFEGGGEQ